MMFPMVNPKEGVCGRQVPIAYFANSRRAAQNAIQSNEAELQVDDGSFSLPNSAIELPSGSSTGPHIYKSVDRDRTDLVDGAGI